MKYKRKKKEKKTEFSEIENRKREFTKILKNQNQEKFET